VPQQRRLTVGLFGDRRQLIIHHVMFGPDWEAACPSCTNAVDELSDGRGNEYTPSLYTLLDLTALGRQEAWEEPKGRAPCCTTHSRDEGQSTGTSGP
jgi:predicted dithiol-disulfide oxidoreductase (DUF899 family)